MAGATAPPKKPAKVWIENARPIDVGRKDRIIGRMIHAVGEPQQHRAGNQPAVTEMYAEHDQREAAKRQAHQQDLAGADMVGNIAHWRLRQGGYDGEHGQREAKLEVVDAELFFQKGEQHRRHREMEMADPMRRRNTSQRAQRGVRLGLLRCGHNVDHVLFYTLLNLTARHGPPKLPAAGYLSMNTDAWQP